MTTHLDYSKIEIKNTRVFTLDDLTTLTEIFTPKEIHDMGLVDYFSDEQLSDSGYIIGDVTFGNKTYTIVHGFAGDNPSGAMFRNNESPVHIGELITLDDEEDTIMQEWYNHVTADKTDYHQDYWYSQ